MASFNKSDSIGERRTKDAINLIGSPSANEIAIFQNSDSLSSSSKLTFDGERLIANGTGVDSVCIGKGASTIEESSICIGENSSCTATGTGSGISIGYGASTLGSIHTGANGIAIGTGASSNDSYGLAIGRSALASYLGIALGYSSSATHDYSVAIGYQATTDSSSQIVLGRATNSMIKCNGNLHLLERSGGDTAIAGIGQIYVKNTTPNELWFRDDAGTDHQIAYV